MKVCILGDGLTSLTLAKALINCCVRVDLVSLKKVIYDKQRTIGISKSNIDFFNKNILKVDKLTWNVKNIEVYTSNSLEKKILNFENKNNQLFSVIKNHKLYELLKKELNKNSLFKKKKKFNISNSHYDLIINCDKNNSITKAFFEKKTEKKYQSFAHTSIINHKKILNNNIAIQIFTKKGPIAFLPLSQNETSVIYSMRGKSFIDKEDFKKLIEKFTKKFLPTQLEKISSFELKSFNLRTYRHKNVLAFGELLYKIHPLAGQGFNMIIRDIIHLIKLINDRQQLGLPLDKSILINFEKNKKHKNYLFSSGIDLIYEFFHLESKIDNNLISKSIQYFGKKKLINDFLTKFADKGF